MQYSLLFHLILAIQIFIQPTEAFSNVVSSSSSFGFLEKTQRVLFQQKNDNENKFIIINEEEEGEEELDEATLAELEAGKPSNWMIIQRVCTFSTIENDCLSRMMMKYQVLKETQLFITLIF